jgi:hypothetical protein
LDKGKDGFAVMAPEEQRRTAKLIGRAAHKKARLTNLRRKWRTLRDAKAATRSVPTASTWLRSDAVFDNAKAGT